MKTFFATLLITSSCNAATLFDAIVHVESGGNPNAIGDGGNARGYVQAWRSAWKDGCEYLGVDWDYETGTKDLAKCKAVFYAYTSRYKASTDEERARCWNSGPAWKKKYAKTDKYWNHVRETIHAKSAACTTHR